MVSGIGGVLKREFWSSRAGDLIRADSRQAPKQITKKLILFPYLKF